MKWKYTSWNKQIKHHEIIDPGSGSHNDRNQLTETQEENTKDQKI